MEAADELLLGACAGGMGMSGATAPNPTVGGAAMFPTKDIVDNAVNSKDHTTLVAAVKAAAMDHGALGASLSGAGPSGCVER